MTYIIHTNGQAELSARERYRRAMVRVFLSKAVTLPRPTYGTPPPSGAAPQELRV